MPTGYLHLLRVDGAAAALERLRADSGIWQAEPWRSMFGVSVTEDRESGSVIYRYEDDHKRPAPAAADVAAAYPDLTLSHEFADELCQIAGRQRFAQGVCIEDTRLDPQQLDWIEWETDEDEQEE